MRHNGSPGRRALQSSAVNKSDVSYKLYSLRDCGGRLRVKQRRCASLSGATSLSAFFAIYQNRVADAVNIPVFLSPLVMVPMLSRMLGAGRRVGILTAGGAHLKGDFLKTVGIDDSVAYAVKGLEHTEEFYNVHVTCSKKTVDPKKMELEVVSAAKELVTEYPDIGCFVFECSDIPPFARAVVQATGRPVFDFISLSHLVGRAIMPPQYPEFWI